MVEQNDLPIVGGEFLDRLTQILPALRPKHQLLRSFIRAGQFGYRSIIPIRWRFQGYLNRSSLPCPQPIKGKVQGQAMQPCGKSRITTIAW